MPTEPSSFLHLGTAATLIGAALSVLQMAPAEEAEAPFRAELLSREQLAERARQLAREHRVLPGRQRGRPLLRRVEESARSLVRSYQAIAAAARRGEPVTPASEWLLDNFHIVEEQITGIRKHLPRTYYAELPKLRDGELAGYPRVYALALLIISHSDGALDEETLAEVVQAYQSISPLSIGELWAVAIMLRVGLVENLRRLTEPLEAQRLARAEADAWAEQVIAAAANGASEVAVVLGQLAGSRLRLRDPFVVRLVQRLRGRGAAVQPVLDWLTRHVSGQGGPTIEERVRAQNQLQAADQVSISNTITSFRLLDRIDWASFFEKVSLVEAVLRRDPAGIYTQCDFATRDACRHEVERIAQRSNSTELEVATEAIDLAREGEARRPGEVRRAHVGYYLIDRGCRELERRSEYRPTSGERVHTWVLDHPTAIFLGAITLFTVLFTAIAVWYAAVAGPDASPWLVALAGLAALIPASDLAVSVVNRTTTLLLRPRVLPKLDFSTGTPTEFRTLVVIPTLLTSEEGVDELLDNLEVHYLANTDRNLHFALLTDFADAPQEEMPSDLALLHRAISGILRLNDRYEGVNCYQRFYLFHRPRKWNPCQEVWMGWERKRGKLMELNRLLRGAEDTSYQIVIGDREAIQGVKYILCLDSDTQLPPESAHRLIGTMAHPLNRPVIDPETRRVVEGYGLLQPRVSINLPSAAQTLFTRIFSGNAGVDPYTTAVSDVYQDLFREGIFCGKGIYDLDAFEQVLEGRVGENELLSHDLFEGSFARCALATDIELFDDYPARYNSHAARQHRWIRGDWQLLKWLAPRVRQPATGGRPGPNPLSAIARWKIFDNLRRSMVAPALALMLALGWLVLPGEPVVWTLGALLVVLFPIYAHLAGALIVDPRAVPWTSYFWNVWYDALTNLEQGALTLSFLMHQAVNAVDAAVRTLWRMFVTRRNLLEWTTAAAAERMLGSDLVSFTRRMAPSVAVSALLLVLVAALRPGALGAALPVLLTWFAAPWVAWAVSRPLRKEVVTLAPDEIDYLRLTARKTWRFFEETVSEADNWLPPDNYQEDRLPAIAHRTSPTNIGLLLLSTVSARDLGYVGLLEMTDRLERTMATLDGMEKFCGHFFNWYDTETAKPILPFYISTVDSGNLAGHLIALKQACWELQSEPVFGEQTLAGLRDVLAGLREALGDKEGVLAEPLATMSQLLNDPSYSGPAWHFHLQKIRSVATVIEQQAASLSEIELGREPRAWIGMLSRSAAELQRDLETLIPWAGLLTMQPVPFGDGKPLFGDLEDRPHVFAELVTPPGKRPRGLFQLAEAMDRALAHLERLYARLELDGVSPEQQEAARTWLGELRNAFEQCRVQRVQLLRRLSALAEQANRMVEEMSFAFLYDEARDLFAVGYNVTEARLDGFHYDLLASECRLASFVAIAKREVPQKHWFRMGRALTSAGGERALVSWSGTMFEYLMPLLVMRSYGGTLLAETMPAVVRQQQRYAAREGVPWGISESGFSARDPGMSYQYHAFGVPGLGLKADLSEDLVIAPYATLLALPLAPREAVRNLEALEREGGEGPLGFYEAIDYTPTRLPRGERSEVVRSYMAHHQGMALVSLANYLLGDPMQQRFHADPLVKSAELLLQERNPREATPAHPQTQEVLAAQTVRRELAAASVRHYTTAQTSTPRVQLLSNGSYAGMVTNSGGSYSTWKGIAVTRWREDPTRDHWGTFLYLRDLQSGSVWSATQQPLPQVAAEYEVYFTEDKAEFQRREHGIMSRLEVCVSPEDDVEIRRLTLTNLSDQPREIEVTSYAEVVLAKPQADMAHTTFSNLFLETEFRPERTALLATRRPRAAGQERLWAVHVLAHEGVPAEIWAATEYETDRARFTGRGRTTANPLALETNEPLSGATGPVLDPIFSLRQKVRMAPRQTVQLAYITGAAASREEALALAERYHDLRAAGRAFELAWTNSQVELRHLGLTPEQANLCQRLASRVLYVDSYVRPPAEVLARNTQGQSGLWAYGISGDLPIVLAQVDSFDDLPLVCDLLVAHEYLRLKGLSFDLVILNAHPPGYLQPFEEALFDAARNEGAYFDQPGGVFIRKAEHIPDAGRHLLLFVARAVFNGDYGSLAHQLDWRPERKEPPAEFQPARAPLPPQHHEPMHMDLRFFNGFGGFSADGREYVMLLFGREWTPAPWINVIANKSFGFLASEAGLGYTWSGNSRENRLTPWSNDPVSDTPGEVLYLRHEDTGRLWSPTPLPIRERNTFVVRHGPGYTTYQHESHGLNQELTVFTPPDEPVKIVRLKLRNVSDRVQRVSATYYAEWVLGVLRDLNHPYVVTSLDSATGALLARNSYNTEFAQRIAFLDVNRMQRTVTGDRTEFLGRNGSYRSPRALSHSDLSGTVGAQLDPCGAVQVKLAVQPETERELIFTLGEGADLAEVRNLVNRYRDPKEVDNALATVRQVWEDVLGTVQVETPDGALDLLLNRWLLYQVLACRVWARSALYQSGGAFGFRDQLQDVMALISSGSALGWQVAREQILLHASRQFIEGDVQHWWHPPTGRGVRTRFSDDLLWLPYVTHHYVKTTGDTSILSEQALFLIGRPLAEGEDEYYDLPTVADESATLYEHCLRAIRKGMTQGAHGLPLFGSGDWNDGMNRVGHEGRGESVWVGWFLCSILQDFAPICELRGEHELAEELRAEVVRLQAAIEEHAWDGEWYRRAYFDDGTPLGSKVNEECKIDAIAQSWSVISGAGDPARSRQAMESVEKYLVNEKDELILLFTPAFDKSSLDPGYIKGYVPGVRENGGQYTHAALWTVLATALLGKGKRAHELFTLLNPIWHGDTPEAVAKYKVEPYVVAADVYGVPPHTGRGGWTWYTGSASWMYRVGLEALLGFSLLGDALTMNPCIPAEWPGFRLNYCHGETKYVVTVENPDRVETGVREVTLDGNPVPDGRVPLVDDGREHAVRVVMGTPTVSTAGDGRAPIASPAPTPAAGAE
ncbi:MAG: GH36-type glycosyl hydrolase domain-containing protein [Armatimonadota bacterium]